MIGILLNILLFAGKLTAGKLSGSVSITADAFNNLADAATVFLSAVGVKIAAIGPWKRHQEGHGKFEWIIALVTSLSVFIVGWELMQASIEEIRNPTGTIFSYVSLTILLVSIGVKVFLYLYNMRLSKSQSLISLKAVALDSISDAFATAAILFSLLLYHWFGWELDGWFGLAVSLLIMRNAVLASYDSVTRLMGRAPSQEKIDELTDFVGSFFTDTVPICDVMMRDQGYGRCGAAFYLLSTEKVPVSELVRTVPLIEDALTKKFGYTSLIQVEETVDTQTQAELLERVRASMASAGYPYELQQPRVTVSRGDHRQLVMTVIIPWLNKKRREELDSFLSDKTALGLTEDDSTQISLRLSVY